jgi:hypothetical protein
MVLKDKHVFCSGDADYRSRNEIKRCYWWKLVVWKFEWCRTGNTRVSVKNAVCSILRCVEPRELRLFVRKWRTVTIKRLSLRSVDFTIVHVSFWWFNISELEVIVESVLGQWTFCAWIIIYVTGQIVLRGCMLSEATPNNKECLGGMGLCVQ